MTRRKKVVNKDILNISFEDAQEGTRLIYVSLLNNEMDKPSFVEALRKKNDALGNKVGCIYVVSTFDLVEEAATRTREIAEKEALPTSAVTNSMNICIHLNLIFDNHLKIFISPLMTKSPTPTPFESPKSLSKNTHSPQHHATLSLSYTSDSDTL